jgi:hypothetical protein
MRFGPEQACAVPAYTGLHINLYEHLMEVP